jgi:hypothetical protein
LPETYGFLDRSRKNGITAGTIGEWPIPKGRVSLLYPTFVRLFAWPAAFVVNFFKFFQSRLFQNFSFWNSFLPPEKIA